MATMTTQNINQAFREDLETESMDHQVGQFITSVSDINTIPVRSCFASEVRHEHLESRDMDCFLRD